MQAAAQLYMAKREWITGCSYGFHWFIHKLGGEKMRKRWEQSREPYLDMQAAGGVVGAMAVTKVMPK
ncbi:hypothetical protein DKX38_010651 [Salix brachista]|uniref:Uncharacterized protein n=1 Tax=Salix brachista TaxID=2182728 RepID=A0A5N5MDS9_9ROSI|nr:hypothetical protein DKX38_010651 [Salix brachista]